MHRSSESGCIAIRFRCGVFDTVNGLLWLFLRTSYNLREQAEGQPIRLRGQMKTAAVLTNIEQDFPFVSVIVPVLDDSERLALCFESLERQTYPRNRYDVIVVDNGSAQSIKPVVARFRQARATYENRPSSYAARNTGISLAEGDILAFTDADPFMGLDRERCRGSLGVISMRVGCGKD